MKNPSVEWKEAYSNLREALGLPGDDPTPKIPRSPRISQTVSSSTPMPTTVSQVKRKKRNDDGIDVEMSPEVPDSTPANNSLKRSKTDVDNAVVSVGSDVALQNATAAAAYIAFLEPENLLPPKMPTRQEMESVLLGIQKKLLTEEYFGDGDQKLS